MQLLGAGESHIPKPMLLAEGGIERSTLARLPHR